MSIEPRHFHEVATLLADGSDEAAWRSAVSRAYYAAYHACDAWHDRLPLPGSVVGEGGSHQQLCSRLKNPAPGTEAEAARRSRLLGQQLNALRARRKLADYLLQDSIDQHEAKTMCATVGLMLDKAK